MAMRGAVKGGVSTTLAVLLFAVLAAGNYVSARHVFHRFDLTRNQEFTVAPATKRVLASLDDVVNIKVYISKNLPEQAAGIRSKVRDLLGELDAYAKGKLKIEALDPNSSPELEAKVRSMGIPKVPLAVLEKNRQQTIEVYLGIAVLYADKKEVIPVVLDNTNLEYELVSAILKVTREKKAVGFLTGHEERDLAGDYRAVSERLRQQYDVETVDLGGTKSVPDKVTTLVIAGPKKPLDDHARYEIDQFVMRGGKVLFLIDAFQIDPGQLMVRPLDVGLTDQIASYGVRIKPALVGDWAMNEVVQMQGGGSTSGMPMSYIVPYPLWPKVITENLSEKHPIVNQLSTLVLPWTAPLEKVVDADDKFEVSELAKSTEYALAEEHLMSANPRSMRQPEKDQMKQYLLAAAVTGPQKSFFAGKPVPSAAEPAPAPDAAPTPAPAATPVPVRKDATDKAQMVVVGGSEFATDSMLRQRAFAADLFFFQNAVDWLTMGDELIGIRSRLAGDAQLDPRKRKIGEAVAPWLNIIVVPALVAIFGLAWRTSRTRRRVVLG